MLFLESYNVFINKMNEPYFGDVGAGILPICRETGRILVAYRSKQVNEPHTWNVFGGKMDEDETPALAANRELVEECGCRCPVELIPAYIFRTPNKSFEYHNFIGIVDKEFEPKLDWETEKSQWISLKELYDLKPKHFGLEALIEHSKKIIDKYAR